MELQRLVTQALAAGQAVTVNRFGMALALPSGLAVSHVQAEVFELGVRVQWDGAR